MKNQVFKQFLVLLSAFMTIAAQVEAQSCEDLDLMGGYKLCVNDEVALKFADGGFGFDFRIAAFFPQNDRVRLKFGTGDDIVGDYKIENIGVMKGEMAGLKIGDTVHPTSLYQKAVIAAFFPYSKQMAVQYDYDSYHKHFKKKAILPIKDIGITTCIDCKPR